MAKGGTMAKKKLLDPLQLPGGDYLDLQMAKDLREDFFPNLKLCKGEWAGKSLRLLDFQFDEIVKPLLCRKRPDGRRRYRKAFIAMPRKNAKTTLSAAISLFHLLLSGEQGGEVAFAASDANQAAIAFGITKSMLESYPFFASRCKIYRREIHYKPTGSVMKVYSSEASTLHGANLSFALADEIHLWKGRDLWDAIVSGCAGRLQSQVVAITTAGHDRESLCFEQWKHAERVKSGEVEDPNFLPVIYGLRHDQDPGDPKTWAECNPGLGQTVYLDFLQEQYSEALLIPARMDSFLQLHLNAWRSSSSTWIPFDRWQSCKGDRPTDDVLKKSPAVMGLDLSAVSDLTAISIAWKLPDDRFFVDTHCFLPEAVVDRERSTLTPWRDWAKKGWLTLIPGDVIEFDFVKSKILALAEKFGISEIVCDRWQIAQLAAELQSSAGFNITGHGQGYASMDPSTKGWERAILSGQLLHDGNEILAYCQGNCGLVRDPAGNQKPNKTGSRSQRIDATVAALMALDRLRVVAPTGGWDGGVVFV
jgi:phage terminase large subunit-like protein